MFQRNWRLSPNSEGIMFKENWCFTPVVLNKLMSDTKFSRNGVACVCVVKKTHTQKRIRRTKALLVSSLGWECGRRRHCVNLQLNMMWDSTVSPIGQGDSRPFANGIKKAYIHVSVNVCSWAECHANENKIHKHVTEYIMTMLFL